MIFDVLEGTEITLKFDKKEKGIFVGLDICLVSCRHTVDKEISEEVKFMITINSQLVTIYARYIHESQVYREKLNVDFDIVTKKYDVYQKDITIGNDHTGGSFEIDIGDIPDKILSFFSRLFSHWKLIILLVVTLILTFIITYCLCRCLVLSKKTIDYTMIRNKTN